MNFWESTKPQNCSWNFGWRNVFLVLALVVFTILKEFMIPGPNRLPIVLPTSGLLNHYPENLVHSKTMKFRVRQIPYSESSRRLSGCSILCSWQVTVTDNQRQCDPVVKSFYPGKMEEDFPFISVQFEIQFSGRYQLKY